MSCSLIIFYIFKVPTCLITGVLAVNNALIVKANIPASNGVIHKVDSILLPSVGLPPYFGLPSGSSRRHQDPLFSGIDGMNRLNLLK